MMIEFQVLDDFETQFRVINWLTGEVIYVQLFPTQNNYIINNQVLDKVEKFLQEASYVKYNGRMLQNFLQERNFKKEVIGLWIREVKE